MQFKIERREVGKSEEMKLDFWQKFDT